jgi:hypothetical protein
MAWESEPDKYLSKHIEEPMRMSARKPSKKGHVVAEAKVALFIQLAHHLQWYTKDLTRRESGPQTKSVVFMCNSGLDESCAWGVRGCERACTCGVCNFACFAGPPCYVWSLWARCAVQWESQSL